jgi:hypothetical protein
MAARIGSAGTARSCRLSAAFRKHLLAVRFSQFGPSGTIGAVLGLRSHTVSHLKFRTIQFDSKDFPPPFVAGSACGDPGERPEVPCPT